MSKTLVFWLGLKLPPYWLIPNVMLIYKGGQRVDPINLRPAVYLALASKVLSVLLKLTLLDAQVYGNLCARGLMAAGTEVLLNKPAQFL